MDKKKRCITTTQASTQTNSTTYNSDEEDKSWELKKRYVQRAREKNKKTFISLSLSPRFRNLALPNIWFPKKTKATVKVTVKCPLFSSCVAPFSPSYVLPIHSSLSLSLSLSLYLSLSRYIYWNIFYFLKLFKFQSHPKKKTIYIYIYIYILYNFIFWILLSEILDPVSYNFTLILFWYGDKKE